MNSEFELRFQAARFDFAKQMNDAAAASEQRFQLIGSESEQRLQATSAEFEQRFQASRSDFAARINDAAAASEQRFQLIGSESEQRLQAISAEFEQRLQASNAEFDRKSLSQSAELDVRFADQELRFAHSFGEVKTQLRVLILMVGGTWLLVGYPLLQKVLAG